MGCLGVVDKHFVTTKKFAYAHPQIKLEEGRLFMYCGAAIIWTKRKMKIVHVCP